MSMTIQECNKCLGQENCETCGRFQDDCNGKEWDDEKADEFFTWCQELWETTGNANQLDEDFVNLLYHKLKNHLPELKEVI